MVLAAGRLIDTVEEFWTQEDWSNAVANAKQDCVGDFCRSFVEFLGAQDFNAFPCATGEEALYWALRVALSRTSRRKVLVSGFNCPVVFQAVRAAGGDVVEFDRPAPNQYADEIRDLIVQYRPAALIVTHFFGVPEDFLGLIEFARSHGVFLVEDCAHCIGAEVGNRVAGTLADAAIFSFNYDKPISLLGGGILLLAAPYAQQIQGVGYMTGGLHSARQKYEHISVLLMRLWLYWRRHPFGIGGFLNRCLVYFIGRYITRLNRSTPLGPIRASLGLSLLQRYYAILQKRRDNAACIRFPSAVTGWQHASTVKPAWLKQKSGPYSPNALARVAQVARSERIRIGNYNWPDCSMVDRDDNARNAGYARHWLDVPVHQNLGALNIQQVNGILHDIQ